jgi:hypothetical protein
MVNTHWTPDQRVELGRSARREVPRSSHAEWSPAPDRPDPVELLEEQHEDRPPDSSPCGADA